MKRILCLFTLCLLLAASPLSAQHLSISPDKPLPGEKISLTYTPKGSPLEGVEKIHFAAYLFEEDAPSALDIEMAFDGNTYTGQLVLTAATKAFSVAVHDGKGEPKFDTNGDMGYKKLCFMPDRTTPVQGAYYQKAMLVSGWGDELGLKSDKVKAYELMKKELEAYPTSKDNSKFMSNYARLAKSQKDEAGLAEVKKHIERLSAKKKATEDELWTAYLLSDAIQEKELGEGLKARMEKAFPNGIFARDKLFNSFRQAKTIEEKLAIVEKYKKLYSKEKLTQQHVENWYGSIGAAYAEQGDMPNAKKYLAMMKNGSDKASRLNNIAWTLTGESLDGEAGDLEAAKALSAESLKLLEEQMADPSQKAISYLTPSQWQRQLKSSYAMYSDTYALALFRTGNVEEALKYQQISCDNNKFGDGEMNERYCAYLEAAKGGKEAEKMLDKLITAGTASTRMKEQHKRLFLANNTLESAYDKYLVKLEEKALERMQEELKAKMLDKKAPGFRLLNLKGEEVSLEALQGKVVVVDFWATWCGPCVASFPGMQKAVNRFAQNEDVAFVFVDTWENNVADKKKNAGDFIESKKYTFNVLLDEKSEVVSAFEVSGIPTKFVIDKQGVIRFKSVGFGGNDDELVKELTMMIEMAGGSAPKLTGAP